VSEDKGYPDKVPDADPIDLEADQRELEAGGWERVEIEGHIFWVNPESDHRYPQGPAIRRLRQQRNEGALESGDDS
jgi:hypothetical protein